MSSTLFDSVSVSLDATLVRLLQANSIHVRESLRGDKGAIANRSTTLLVIQRSDQQFQQNSSVENGSGVPFSHRAVLCNEVSPQMAKTHMFLACVLGI